MRDGSALKRGHLAEGSHRRRQVHRDEPRSYREPAVHGVFVRRQLRRQAVQSVGQPGAHRDERAGGSPGATEGVRRERDDGNRRQRSPELRPVCASDRSLGRQPGNERHGGDDRCDGDHLPAAYRLVEALARDQDDEHEPERERRLDERKRHVCERQRLQTPACQTARRTDQPLRPAYQLTKESDPEGTVLRHGARLHGLQRDSHRVQHGRGQRQRETGDDRDHDRPAR